mmetsp:Transcript_22236/g.48386  ORF Transcript_22236/g.48386 Transcript_22236/m.48386 type:complete len:117 (+) Transcript_22236:1521-1871(+)
MVRETGALSRDIETARLCNVRCTKQMKRSADWLRYVREIKKMRASLTGDEATFATKEDSVPLLEAAAGELHEAMDAMRAVAARRRQLEQQAQAYNCGTVVAANLRQNDELQHLFLW